MIGEGYTDDCLLFRNAHISKIRNNEIGANIFDPVPAQLSTDWDKYTDPHECLVRIGLTYKHGKTIFKNQRDFRLFELNVGDIRKITAILDILHTEINNTPEEIGFPNNPSHTDVLYMDEEVRLKLKEIAKEVLVLDRDSVDIEVEKKKVAQG